MGKLSPGRSEMVERGCREEGGGCSQPWDQESGWRNEQARRRTFVVVEQKADCGPWLATEICAYRESREVGDDAAERSSSRNAGVEVGFGWLRW